MKVLELICILQGLPAALAHPVFGRFLDRCENLPIQRAACSTVLQLSRSLCQTYWSTLGKVAAQDIRGAIPDAILCPRGGEREMMSQFRRILLEHFRSQIPAAVLTLEPSTSLVGAHYHQLIAGSMLLYSDCVIKIHECPSRGHV